MLPIRAIGEAMIILAKVCLCRGFIKFNEIGCLQRVT